MNQFTNLTILCFTSILMACSGCSKENDTKNPSRTENDRRPYSQYMLTNYGSYIEIPHHSELNPVEGITLEGWVRLDNTAARNILIHKRLDNETERYAVEVTELEGKPLLGSYMGYANSRKWAGNYSTHTWIHWAVTSDGVNRKHYINGELAGNFSEEPGAFQASTAPLLIAKTVAANTGFAELRLWNIVRSPAEITQTMNQNIESAIPGLIAVWPLAADADDIIGGHDGIMHNSPKFKTWSE